MFHFWGHLNSPLYEYTQYFRSTFISMLDYEEGIIMRLEIEKIKN